MHYKLQELSLIQLLMNEPKKSLDLKWNIKMIPFSVIYSAGYHSVKTGKNKYWHILCSIYCSLRNFIFSLSHLKNSANKWINMKVYFDFTNSRISLLNWNKKDKSNELSKQTILNYRKTLLTKTTHWSILKGGHENLINLQRLWWPTQRDIRLQ